MKRIAIIGVLVLMLATLAGPALAQEGEGSVLPEPGQEQPLPVPDKDFDVTPVAGAPLADTGFQVSNAAALGLGLLALGGVALLISRRRVTG